MDLKTISLSQIEDTFLMFESTLHGIIQVNRCIPDRMVISDVDYLTVLWILVTENQQLRMYDTIRLRFSSFLGDLAISNVRYYNITLIL